MGGQIFEQRYVKARRGHSQGASSIFDVAKSGIWLIIGNYTEPKMRDAMARCGNSFQKEAASKKLFPAPKYSTTSKETSHLIQLLIGMRPIASPMRLTRGLRRVLSG